MYVVVYIHNIIFKGPSCNYIPWKKSNIPKKTHNQTTNIFCHCPNFGLEHNKEMWKNFHPWWEAIIGGYQNNVQKPVEHGIKLLDAYLLLYCPEIWVGFFSVIFAWVFFETPFKKNLVV